MNDWIILLIIVSSVVGWLDIGRNIYRTMFYRDVVARESKRLENAGYSGLELEKRILSEVRESRFFVTVLWPMVFGISWWDNRTEKQLKKIREQIKADDDDNGNARS